MIFICILEKHLPYVYIFTIVQRYIEDYPELDVDHNQGKGVGDEPTTEVTNPTTVKTTTARTVVESVTIKSEDPTKPNLCKDGYDTIAFIRNEIFIFKNEVRTISKILTKSDLY